MNAAVLWAGSRNRHEYANSFHWDGPLSWSGKRIFAWAGGSASAGTQWQSLSRRKDNR